MTIQRLLALGALLASLAPVACATQAEDDGEDAEASEDNLSTAGRALIGAYTSNDGALRALVLTEHNENYDVPSRQRVRFFADADTGVRCATAPCPSSERIEGTWSAGAKQITLRSTTASPRVQKLLGRYNYKVQGNKLTLTRAGTSLSFEKGLSYCAEADDCYRQSIVAPACWGQTFTCSASNTCDWKCGGAPPPDPCSGKDEASCQASSSCEPEYGASCEFCADWSYKGCHKKNEPSEERCMSSSSCAAGTHCSTEDGECLSMGMLAVCGGRCVPNP